MPSKGPPVEARRLQGLGGGSRALVDEGQLLGAPFFWGGVGS